jgi:hypothetical protein
MPALNVALDYQLLVRVLHDPATIDRLSPEAFGRAMDAAQRARLLGWLVEQVRAGHLPPEPPDWLRDRLVTAEALVRGYERAVRWEIDRLNRAFLGTGQVWILLKGAAYIAAVLPPGSGRRVADIDVLVPWADLAGVEGILHEHGWEFPEIDAYDTQYYREWMHELPPMVHHDRRSIVDVHHAILPRTSRLKPSSERLLERAVSAVSADGMRVLCPSHMVLHAAAHMFHDGEIAGAIRDLIDLDQLLRWFGGNDEFWTDLVREAEGLDLTRPAYYALRYAGHWFNTPVPERVAARVSRWGPPLPIRGLMDALVRRSMTGASPASSPAAVFALYVRSHWLRMPPLHLVRHLARKSFRGR